MKTGEEPGHQRKFTGLFINHSFQLKFIGITFASMVLLSACYFLAVYYFFTSFEDMGYSAGFPKTHVFFDFLSKQNHLLFSIMSGAFFIVMAISAVLGYWFSHKVAGPLQRLMTSFDEMEKNKALKPITFRKGDLFQEIPEKFNSLVKTLNDQ